jgi:hypothetical protein
VGSPGDVGPVDQTNDAQANAGSQADVAGSASADATATQTSPLNVNVNVRVGSPGDNGAVTQTNSAGATATGGNTPAGATATPPASLGPAGTDQSVTTGGSAAVTNDGNVQQLVEQLADNDGPADPASTPSPAAGSSSPGNGTATTTQTGALNASVSIRIGSPGNDGVLTQSNAASATGSTPAQSILTVTGGTNIGVALVLPTASPSAVPAGDWLWNWVWDGSWTLPTVDPGSSAPTTDSIWNWLWQNAPATGASGASAGGSTGAGVDGLWSWNWTWTLAGGQVWTLNWQQACTCSWAWNWNWDWSDGTPASTPAAPTQPVSAPGPFDASTDEGPVVQTNVVDATAAAGADASLARNSQQTVLGTDPALGFAGASVQRFATAQDAEAYAVAGQADASNVRFVWDVPVASVQQTNEIAAKASASAEVTALQLVVQEQETDAAIEQWLEADQAATNAQTAVAVAQTAQNAVQNLAVAAAPHPHHASLASIEQRNSVAATATSDASAAIGQWIGQTQLAGDAGVELGVAQQLHANAQTAIAGATAAQAGNANRDVVTVPAGSRATNPSVRQQNLVRTTSSSVDTGSFDGEIQQGLGGTADGVYTIATQEGTIRQSAASYSPASQSNLLNSAGWNGVEPPADEPVDDPGPGPDSPAATAPGPGVVPGAVFAARYGPRRLSPSRTVHRPHQAPHGSPRHLVVGTSVVSSSSVAYGTEPPAGAPFLPPVTPVGAPKVAPAAPPAPSVSSAASWPAAAVASTQAASSTKSTTTTARVADDGGRKPHRRAHHRDTAATSWPVLDPASASGIGSSPAPGGGGATGVALDLFKLATPALVGSQMPTPILGRSVAYLEPPDRPG